MTFATQIARALLPVALIATVAAPAPAASSADLKAVEASLAATTSMTANFLQTDGKGRQMAGTQTRPLLSSEPGTVEMNGCANPVMTSATPLSQTPVSGRGGWPLGRHGITWDSAGGQPKNPDFRVAWLVFWEPAGPMGGG